MAKKVKKKVAPKSAKKTVKKTVKKVAKKTAKSDSKSSPKKAASKVAKKTNKKVTKKAPAKKAVAKKVVKKAPAKKVVAKKVTKKAVAKKVVKKVTKKAIPKTKPIKSIAVKEPKAKKENKKLSKKEAIDLQKKSKSIYEGAEEELELLADGSDEFDADFEEFEKSAKKAKKGPKASEIQELESKISDQITDLREAFKWEEIAGAISSLDFFVNQRNDECSQKNCDNLRTTQAYCRYHYIANWYEIQKKREILAEGKLQEYIEELVAKYPPKLIEAIVSDLQDDKDFYRALSELGIAQEFDYEDEVEVTDDVVDDDEDIIEAREFTVNSRFDDD